eukprot:SAG11_NODE_17225_length_524_cov_1.828235_2_plen_39_part_01
MALAQRRDAQKLDSAIDSAFDLMAQTQPDTITQQEFVGA